jgi:hypothetical protein
MFGRKIKQLNFDKPYEYAPVPVVGHAAATLPQAMGGLTAILIIDTRNRPDIDEYVNIHRNSGAGDVESQWGRRVDDNSIYQLVLEVIRPVELNIYLEFKFPDKISVIDQILHTQRLCLQPGRPGDTLSQTFNTVPRVIMEIPDTGIGKKWNTKLLKHFTKMFQGEGLNKRQAEEKAAEFIRTRRQIFDFRMSGL